MDDEPAVKVTLPDIYAVAVKREKKPTDLTKKVEGFLGQAGDHENRIRALESS